MLYFAFFLPHICKLAESHVIELLEMRTLQIMNQTEFDPWDLLNANGKIKLQWSMCCLQDKFPHVHFSSLTCDLIQKQHMNKRWHLPAHITPITTTAKHHPDLELHWQAAHLLKWANFSPILLSNTLQMDESAGACSNPLKEKTSCGCLSTPTPSKLPPAPVPAQRWPQQASRQP